MPRVPARSNDNMGQTQARVSLTTDDENMTELHGSHVEDPRDTLNQIDLGTIVMDERVRAYIQQGISDTEDKWYHYTIRLKNTLNVQHREIQNLKRLDRNPELDATHANAYQASDDCATISKSVLAQLEEDKNELEQVKKDLAGKIEECGQLRSAWQEAAEEVQALSVTDRGFTVDDETVTSKWRSLHYDIRNLTALHFNGRGSTNQLNRSLRDNFKKMCLMYKEFLRHEDMPQYLFQASIWQFLRKNLFKSPLRVFGTPTMDLINDLSEQITTNGGGDAAKDANSMRATIGHTIHKHLGPLEGLNQSLSDKLTNELYSARTTESGEEEIAAEIRGIMTKAMELAVIFSQAKSKFHCVMQWVDEHGDQAFHGFEVNTAWMDAVVDHRRRTCVELMVSPALVKFGNSKGENYDQRDILVREDVYC